MDFLDYLMPAGMVLDEDARRKAAAQAAMPQPAQSFISPEQAQQMGAPQGASEAELQELKRRMAMAAAARGQHHTTALGGLFGGLSDALNGYTEGKLAKEYAAKLPGSMPAQAEQLGLQEKQTATQEGLLKLAKAKRLAEGEADTNSPSNQFRGSVIRQASGMEQLPEGLNPSDVTEQDIGMLARLRGQDRLKIFRAGNGETVAFDPMSGEAETLRDAPPPKASGGGRGGATSPALTPAAIDLMVENAHVSGALPQGMGRDKETQRAIINAWAAKYPQDRAAIIRSGYEANKHALGDITTKTASLEAFANTAQSTAEQAAQLIDKIPNLGSTTINAIGRKVAAGTGSPDMARFWAAHQSAVSEIAKVLSGGGAPSDSQRAEAAHLLNEAYSPEQYKAAVGQLGLEMHKRVSNMHEQADRLRGGGQASDTVQVVSPEGKPGRIPRSKLELAKQRGFKVVGE